MTAARTAYRDQYDAATAEAARAIAAVLARPGARTAPATDRWLRGQLAALRVALRTGQVRLCPHIGYSPTVAHAALWAPWSLVCSACLPTLSALDAAEDATCDRCRHRAAQISPAMVQVGPVLVAFGLCDHCAHQTTTRSGGSRC